MNALADKEALMQPSQDMALARSITQEDPRLTDLVAASVKFLVLF